MKLYMMRHGQTDFNRQKRLQGHMEIPLNETGIAQAEALHEEFRKRDIHFDRVYVSPLQRAIHTAEIASGIDRSTFIKEPRLIEIDFGYLEGIEYSKMPPSCASFFSDPSQYIPPEDGETIEAMTERMMDFLHDDAVWEGEGDILAASHGTAMHGVLRAFHGTPLKDFWVEPVTNCDVLVFERVNGEVRILDDEKISVAKGYTL